MNLSSREFASHELGAKLRSQSNCDRSDSNFRPMKDLRNGVGVSFCWPLSPETETAAFGIGAVDCVSHAFMLHCSTSGYSVLTAVEHSQNPMARRPRLPLHGLCNLYEPSEKTCPLLDTDSWPCRTLENLGIDGAATLWTLRILRISRIIKFHVLLYVY